MSTIVFASVRNRPGTSTVWLLCALSMAASGRPVVAVETDPDGNDLAATFDLGQTPGLVSLAAASRREGPAAANVDDHARRLPDGLSIVPGPVAAEDAAAAVATLAPRLGALAERDGRLWSCDVGRLGPSSPALAIAASASVTVLVCGPTRTEALALPSRVAALRGAGCRLGLAVVGAGPYRPAEVAEHGRVDLLGVFPAVRDPGGLVAAAVAGRRGRRSLLWQGAVELSAAIATQLASASGDERSAPGPAMAGAR
jgi:hypothetical protein